MNTPRELFENRPKITDEAAMQDLLEKTRVVSRVLQARKDRSNPDYPKLARLLCDLSAANVYIINKDGRILGYAWTSEYDCPLMAEILMNGAMPASYVEKANQVHESVLNHTDHGLCAYADQPCAYSNKHVVMVPINGAGDRLGTLILARFGYPFDTRDLKSIEERGRERLVVQMAMRALSYSEVESVRHIIEDLGGPEGVVVASKVADRVGVTRSVIVNALRKLGSAGIIESRSLGMKGTYIKVLSPLFLEELGIASK